ncbi:MAG: glycosyltransferase family 39 protein [Chloroflexota bacterium]
MLDEGAYVYKGYLFASGQYQPYQPYGPWSNHMPLAFLIPGYIQEWFGPGLRTARLFAIFTAILMLLGLWLLIRRLSTRGWAASAIWIMALNPAMLKAYSTAVSQGLTACMLVWVLVLVLGERRSVWQLVLGSILAGLIVMTRENMLPILPLLVLYLLWEYGWRIGLLSAFASGLTLIFFFALYWPNIMQVWNRLPRWATPFLSAWRLPKDYDGTWDPTVTNAGRVLSFFHALRFQFASIIGPLAAVLLWPKTWKSKAQFRSGVFLLALFVALMATHMWAALGKEYCVFCLAGYVAFFSPLGLILLILTFQNWRSQLPIWLQVIIIVMILSSSAGLGFGSFEELGKSIYNISIPQWLLGSSTPGSAALGAVLVNKFGLLAQDLRRILPTVFGFALGVLVLLLAWSARKITHSRRQSFGYWSLVTFLVLGILLSPTLVLGGGYNAYDCSEDVIASYEAAGQHLAATIPPGSRVYWRGTLSAVPLLYVPDIRIYPPQINDGYTYLEGGEDLDQIYRLGRWNEALARQWLDEADILLVEARFFKGWLRDAIMTLPLEQLPPTPPTVYCREDSQILIFKKIP